jgi:hypothetical protein
VEMLTPKDSATLGQALSEHPEARRVAIIYGSGHLNDLASRLSAMGFDVADVEWERAMQIEYGAAGLTSELVSIFTDLARASVQPGAADESQR